MVLHVEDSVIHSHELEGQIGLELETYRVKADGTLRGQSILFQGMLILLKTTARIRWRLIPLRKTVRRNP